MGQKKEIIHTGFVSASCSPSERDNGRNCEETAIICELWEMWYPAGSVFTCEGLWDSNRQECSSSITDNVSVSSCSLENKALREKELHPPRSAETPNREETSRADRLDRWREWSEGIPPVSALHLTAEVSLYEHNRIYYKHPTLSWV